MESEVLQLAEYVLDVAAVFETAEQLALEKESFEADDEAAFIREHAALIDKLATMAVGHIALLVQANM